ncbi:cell division protein FtsZ [Facilibium subflavum]|uniref:cell division protein FtsZ n=1 Tax=Facilibium subflavum TaxID=2219058 RepID=UPI000E658702|nr:cell division protein FtsZ [Facilibium subflavum]
MSQQGKDASKTKADERHLSGFDHGRIKVIGVGGGGGNAVSYMVEKGLQGAKIYAMNTDQQALNKNLADYKIQIGEHVTRGLGAGANPEVGLKAAQESIHLIEEAISDCDMLFITAGMGGGTGTGAANIVAEVARKKGVVTVGVVTTPFSFEGRRREVLARQGISALQEHVNSLIVIPNDKLKKSLGEHTALMDAFHAANDVLYNAMSSMTGIIRTPGHINVDFADVKTVMTAPGLAVIGTGCASGEDRVANAVEKAVSCELLEDIDLRNAKGLLVCVTSSNDISLGEFTELGNRIAEIADEEAPVIIGTAIKEDLGDELDVTIIATGFDVDVTSDRREKVINKRSSDGLLSKEGPSVTVPLARKIKSDYQDPKDSDKA